MVACPPDREERTAARTPARRDVLRAIVAGLAGVGLVLTSQSSRAMPRMARPIDVQATVQAGPSAGLALSGRLWLDLADNGRIPSGELLRPDGTRLAKVHGQIADRRLVLHLRTVDGARLTLIGQLASDIYSEIEPLHGTLSGPESGDYGEWLGTWVTP